MNKKYTPNPVDTADIKLPKECLEIAEKLAENVHEEWAFMRKKEGWVYGEKKDRELKTHPCLVPYEDLPESEKEYDRKTAFSTLKFIINQGFYIKKANKND